MTEEELLRIHEMLREQLSLAYARPSWDTADVDRITSELAIVERHLTSRARTAGGSKEVVSLDVS